MSFFSFIILFVSSLFAPIAQAQTDNQATFEAYLKTVYDAYETGGYDKLMQHYAPTASEIGPDGRLISGLSTLKAAWDEMDKMLDAKPKFTYQLTSWRLVTPDVALITWDTEDEFQIQGQKIVGKHTASALLRKEKGKWLIEHDQLTPKMEFQIPGQQADLNAIKALGNEAYAAFGARDAARFAACYTEDVKFVDPFGNIIKGRAAFEQAHAELFKTMANLPEGKVEIAGMDIHFVNPDVAICQWTHKQTMTINGKAMTEETSLMNTCLRVDGKWLVAAMSLTPVRPIPGMAAPGH